MLYNRQTIHWKLNPGDLVGFTRSPFSEHQVDVVFKVLAVSADSWYMDVEIIHSLHLPIGTTYLNQPTKSFKKVKMTPLSTTLVYDYEA